MQTSKNLFIEEHDQAYCRICYEDSRPMISCCECKGSIGFSHEQCLKEWLDHLIKRNGPDARLYCEVCQQPFNVTVDASKYVFSVATFVSLVCSEQYLAGIIGCVLTILLSSFQLYQSLLGELFDFTRQVFIPVVMIISAAGWLWNQGFIRRSRIYRTEFVLRPMTKL